MTNSLSKFVIGVDTYNDEFAYCLARQVNNVTEIILVKKMRDKKAFKEEVINLTKYFDAMVYEENSK